MKREILDQVCDVVVELACLVCAIGAGALPLGVLVPWALGLGLSLVSGLAYTPSWIRIYEAAGPETP